MFRSSGSACDREPERYRDVFQDTVTNKEMDIETATSKEMGQTNDDLVM